MAKFFTGDRTECSRQIEFVGGPSIRGEMDLFIDVTSKIASSALVEQKRTHYTAPPFLKNKKMSFSWLDTHFDL